MTRRSWPAILEHAAGIVRSYDTGVTLRQLFYRLVADGTLPNSRAAYQQLSSTSADARRAGWFPALIDRGRSIHRPMTWSDPEEALAEALAVYRRDRTEFQDVSVYLGVEKNGLVEQLRAWFGDLGLPILALGGYSGQSYVDQVARDVRRQLRPAVLLYGGDFDPSGEDIDRDFVERSGCWVKVVRVALTAEQVARYDLPPAMGKATDSRAAQFVARHGRLVQVELDAVPPDVLQGLYRTALAEFWDTSVYEHCLERERTDRDELRARLGWSQ